MTVTIILILILLTLLFILFVLEYIKKQVLRIKDELESIDTTLNVVYKFCIKHDQYLIDINDLVTEEDAKLSSDIKDIKDIVTKIKKGGRNNKAKFSSNSSSNKKVNNLSEKKLEDKKKLKIAKESITDELAK